MLVVVGYSSSSSRIVVLFNILFIATGFLAHYHTVSARYMLFSLFTVVRRLSVYLYGVVS